MSRSPNLGYLPTFEPRNLSAMGQYTDPSQANLIVGAGAFTNVQNYQRHELRGTFSQFVDIGKTSHTLKARPRIRIRRGGLQPHGQRVGRNRQHHAGRGAGAARALLHATNAAAGTDSYLRAVRPGRHGVGVSHVAQSRASSESRRYVAARRRQRRMPRGGPAEVVRPLYESNGDTCTFLEFGFSQEVQPRVGFTYQFRDGRGRQGCTRIGAGITTWIRNRARAVSRRAGFSRRRRCSIWPATCCRAGLSHRRRER